MRLRRHAAPILFLTVVLGGMAVEAIAASGEAPPGPPPGASHPGHRAEMFGPMGLLLHRLNLTDAQRDEIRSILAGEKTQFQALHASVVANHEALARTPPSDPNYASLIQTAQANASDRVALMAGVWKQVYESVLTDEQRAQIPSLVASAESARDARLQQWKSRHPADADAVD